MSSLFLFEEKIHNEAIPLLFPWLLSYVLENLGFPTEPHHERRRECEATFTVEKWQFVLRAIPLPTFPLVGED